MLRVEERQPVTPGLSWEDLTAWLATVTPPAGPIRVSSASVVTDPARHVAWLRESVAAQPRGQVRLNVWCAMRRFHEAMEGHP